MSLLDLRQGDCLEVLASLPYACADAIVTDPPYGLSFMGRKWDYDVPSVDIWRECLRVLKPGGHLLAFAGTRTQHRMCVNIEDAGFEIRDMIAWVYGSGFPKSMDISKAIDKRGGNNHLTAEIGAALKAARKARGVSITEADRTYCGGVTLWSWYEGRPAGQQMPTAEVLQKIAADWPELQPYADATRSAEREHLAKVKGARLAVAPGQNNDRSATALNITAPATPEAQQWEGWGTALKPALEPITVARKPFKGTVAQNVLEHGTGGINIDRCRVGGSDGRWPANLIHDGSDEVVELFPDSCSGNGSTRGGGGDKYANGKGFANTLAETGQAIGYGDSGSAARFFYVPKCSKADREGSTHPTMKPTDLMAYLCRLVTPPGGIVLDPFMGSGSTGKAAIREGFGFIGIEREAEYFAIAQQRVQLPEQQQLSLVA